MNETFSEQYGNSMVHSISKSKCSPNTKTKMMIQYDDENKKKKSYDNEKVCIYRKRVYYYPFCSISYGDNYYSILFSFFFGYNKFMVYFYSFDRSSIYTHLYFLFEFLSFFLKRKYHI